MYEIHRSLVGQILKYFKRMVLQKRITPKQISRMPLKVFGGEIVLVQDVNAAKSAVGEIISEKFLGFDIESKPAFSKGESYPPSLMQIAISSKVYLFKLEKIGGLTHLKPILENEDIIKVGAAIDHDIKNLFKIENFNAKGFCDLGVFSKQLKIAHTGLRNLAAIFLRVRISKKSQLTDWTQKVLTPQQISYAATDAWISREIFLKMLKYLP
ncbi:MAG: 3'-5' exonuclease domain-containing protein 2 [Puniceicoccales bacterium]|jgi:ribonuclease D|nr:3'-5' exonuclease domain-containing protein 2 [Puniceicoccales bacterium]